MSVDFQSKQAAFGFGIDEGTDPHAVPMGVLTTLENYVWLKARRIEKRAGVTAISSGIVGGGALGAGNRLFTRNAELLVANPNGIYALGANGWTLMSKLPDASLTWETSYDSSAGVRSACVARSNGYIIQAWISGDPLTTGNGDMAFEVLDATTRARVISFSTGSGTSNIDAVRVLAMGGYAFVVYKNSNAIQVQAINLSTLTFASATLRSDSRTGALSTMDACIVGSTLVICYETAANVLNAYAYTFVGPAAFTQVATGTIATGGTLITPISIDGAAGEAIYVGYSVQSTLKTRCTILNPSTLATTVATFDVDATTNAAYVSVARYDASNFVYLNGSVTRKISALGVIDANSVRGTRDTLPLTRPFMVAGRCYLYLADTSLGSGAGSSAFSGGNTLLVEVETSANSVGTTSVPHRFIGAIDLVVGGAYQSGRLANVAPNGASPVTVLPFLSDAAPTFTNWRQGLRLVTASFGASLSSDHWRSVTVGREAYIAGGALSAYDGRTAFDYGFLRAPIISGTVASPVAAKVGVGTYLYSIVQEQRSHAGVLHRSAATPPITVVLGASSTVAISVVGVSVGNKQNLSTGFIFLGNEAPTTLPVYRSVAGGSIPQRLTYEPGFNTFVCDPHNSNTFTDDKPDTNIGASVALATRPALYTSNGTKDDFPPPACLTMFYHADRLWTLSGDGLSWSFSKTFQDDLGAAPGFHPDFRVVFAEPQTCGATMDEKAVFFSPTGIRYMLGLGPAKDGSNSDFSTPIRVQSDVGCINPRSVVSVPDGLMFLGTTGIYTLTRGMELDWTGRKVQDQLALYPNVTSAVLVAAKREVRFTCNASDGLSGAVLVYNYVEKQWSVSKYLQTAAGVGTAIADACMYLGQWTFLTAAGLIYTESATTSLDAGAYVPGIAETAWISPAGPLAQVAVSCFWLHGVSQSDHELKIEAAFDSNTTYLQQRVFHAGSAVTSVGPLEECKISIGTRRKCNAIRFRVTDSAPLTPGSVLGTGKGPRFETMEVEAAELRGDTTAAGRKG